jgi:ATP-dependent 26S proteasome regulatory subunit
MMERIEMLRDKLDRVYNATVYRLIGAVGVCYAAKVLLATSMFDGMSAWLIAVVMGALFFFKPGVAIFANALVLCLSLAHINALLVVVIAALTLFFCGCNHVLSFWVMLLPLCFLPGNVFSGWQFCALLVGLCLLSRIGSKQLCVLYGVYYSLLALVSGFGGVFPFHYRRVFYTNAQAYLRSLNFKQMYQALLRCNITALIIVIAVYGVLAAALLYLFAKVRLGKKLAFDAADGLKFLIAAAALTAAVFGTAMVFAVDDALPVGAIVLQMVAAYLISRPFASETMVHKLSAGDAAMEGSKNAVSNAEITFDKWDSIAGYEETKKEIQSIIRPYTDKREYDRLVKAGMAPVKGLLLFGPPGTGKTTMARIIANETKMKLIVVNASSFLNMYVGESEKNLVRVFQQARDKAPCIICFDEIESFLMDRSKAERSYETSIVSTFLAQMDGYVDLQDVLVVATTNNPTLIDPAALRPGRFDKLIYVGVPDEAARAVMFEKYLRGKAGTGVDYQKLAENSERFTGADIRGLCEAAFRENDFKPVTEEQLMMRLSITRPSYTLEMQKMYELWGKKYNRSSGAQEDNRNKTAKHLCWDDIKGMDSVKALLREKIELPIQNAEQYKKYGISAPRAFCCSGLRAAARPSLPRWRRTRARLRSMW